MNLYKISQDDNIGYDTYDSAIVAANDENEARLIHPNGHLDAWEWAGWAGSWTNNPRKVKVELIGKAAKGIEAGVILASYNAG